MSFTLPLQRTGHYYMSLKSYNETIDEPAERESFLKRIYELKAKVKIGTEIVHITTDQIIPPEENSNN